MATVDDKKIIFSMVGLNKTIPQNNKQVLKNIYLSFFYGAKIGIIGLNGSGKSTLFAEISNTFPTGPFINSDVIEALVSKTGFLNMGFLCVKNN